jgi:hypothetical protein
LGIFLGASNLRTLPAVALAMKPQSDFILTGVLRCDGLLPYSQTHEKSGLSQFEKCEAFIQWPNHEKDTQIDGSKPT